MSHSPITPTSNNDERFAMVPYGGLPIVGAKPKLPGGGLMGSEHSTFAGGFHETGSGMAHRKYRIGLPPSITEPLSEKLLADVEAAQSESEKRQFKEYQKLRTTVLSLQSQVRTVLDLFAEEPAVEATHPDIIGQRTEVSIQHKLEKLHELVSESMEESRLKANQVDVLKADNDDLQQATSDYQARIKYLEEQNDSLRHELQQTTLQLNDTKSQHLQTISDCTALADKVDQLTRLNEIIQRRHERQRQSLPDKDHGSQIREGSASTGGQPIAKRQLGDMHRLQDTMRRHLGDTGNSNGPQGKVALVFTDIQGSTSLWEALEDRMHSELEKHNKVIRAEIHAWNGYEVKTQGDSFMVAFNDVTKAVCFCMQVQLRLMGCKWDPLLHDLPDAKRRTTRKNGKDIFIWNGLRVRMGLHVGSPICQIDVTSGRMDYFGPVVNQSARVQGIALGGMVSLTQEVKAAIDFSQIPKTLTPRFEDIGVFSLKGISEPIPLQQILPEVLSPRLEDFAPLKTKDKDEDTSNAPVGQVCIVFLRIDSAQLIQDYSEEIWLSVLHIFQNEVRLTSEVVGGYISNVDKDRTTVAFQHTGVAFRWAMELQESLMNLPWNPQLHDIQCCKTVNYGNQDVIKGPRVQVGMHVCTCEHYYDPVTKNMNYVGPSLAVAAALSLEARGAETVVSDAVYEEVSATSKDIFVLAKKDVVVDNESPFDAYFCFPKSLHGRATYLTGVDISNERTPDEVLLHKVTDAPFGRVCIAFTDVQNSTVLWEQNELAMAEAVKMHHSAMRAGIQRFKGYEVKTEGDAFMVAFRETKDAMRWCLFMQESLLTLDYSADFLTLPDAKPMPKGRPLWRGLRVRMGFHVGRPHCEIDPVTSRMDYYGKMVNKAARVSGTAQGGQIVMSDEAFQDISSSLLELGQPTITDGGSVQLKGIALAAKIHFAVPKRLRARTFKESQLAVSTAKPTMLEKMTHELETKDTQGTKLVRAPTGTVAISFTDIQNSTVLWENCKEMKQVVQLHHKLMRDGIREYNGYEVKTEGDAFMVAFHSTQDGIAWCLHMQVLLLKAKWMPSLLEMNDAKPEKSPASQTQIWCGPRVRMGLHVGGEPELGCETDICTGRMDYYGKMVNKAARVSGLGKGGEIVISQDCYTDLMKLPEAERKKIGKVGYESVCLGEKQLKGIDKAVLVHSLVPTGLSERRKTWKSMDAQKAVAQPTEPPDWWEEYEKERLRHEMEQKSAPTGMCTFVFTDVQGSTKLWDSCSKSMADAVRIHHELMRTWIKKMSGYEVKTEGDAFMVTFHNATDAVKWCIATQLELARAAWPAEITAQDLCKTEYDEDDQVIWNGLRVRMGIHCGEVDHVVDETTKRIDYYGPTVNFAARVGGLGIGGEIVCSSEVLEAIPKMTTAGNPIVQYLGPRQLKGISQEAYIYRIIPTDLTGREYPALPPPAPPSSGGKDAKRKISRSGSVAASELSNQDDDYENDNQRRTSKTAGHTSMKNIKKAMDKIRDERDKIKDERNTLRGELTKIRDEKNHAEQERSFEVWRLHRHVREYMKLIKRYVECSLDRTKGVFSQTDMMHEWIRTHRQIMSEESPVETFRPDHRKREEKKVRADVELKTQLGLAIETEREEGAHVELDQRNGQWTIATSKLSRSVVGHLSKQFVYLAKYFEGVKKKGKKRSEQQDAPYQTEDSAAGRRSRIMARSSLPPQPPPQHQKRRRNGRNDSDNKEENTAAAAAAAAAQASPAQSTPPSTQATLPSPAPADPVSAVLGDTDYFMDTRRKSVSVPRHPNSAGKAARRFNRSSRKSVASINQPSLGL